MGRKILCDNLVQCFRCKELIKACEAIEEDIFVSENELGKGGIKELNYDTDPWVIEGDELYSVKVWLCWDCYKEN